MIKIHCLCQNPHQGTLFHLTISFQNESTLLERKKNSIGDDRVEQAAYKRSDTPERIDGPTNQICLPLHL